MVLDHHVSVWFFAALVAKGTQKLIGMLFKRDSRHDTDVALVADVFHWLSDFHKLGPVGFVNDWKMHIRACSRLYF